MLIGLAVAILLAAGAARADQPIAPPEWTNDYQQAQIKNCVLMRTNSGIEAEHCNFVAPSYCEMDVSGAYDGPGDFASSLGGVLTSVMPFGPSSDLFILVSWPDTGTHWAFIYFRDIDEVCMVSVSKELRETF